MTTPVSGSRPIQGPNFWNSNELTEANKKIEDATNAIGNLTNQVSVWKQNCEKARSDFAEKNKNCVSLQRELKDANAKNTELQAEITKLNNLMNNLRNPSAAPSQVVEAPAKQEGICEPTRATLQSMIDKVEPTTRAITTLKEKINALSKQTEESKTWVDTIIADKEAAKVLALLKKDDGSGYVKDFDELKTDYLNLVSTLKEMEKMVQDATYEDVPENHLRTLSSMNDVGMPTFQTNAQQYRQILKDLKKHLSDTLTSSSWCQVNKSFESAMNDINHIQFRYKNKGTSFMMKVVWPNNEKAVTFEKYAPAVVLPPVVVVEAPAKPVEAAAAV